MALLAHTEFSCGVVGDSTQVPRNGEPGTGVIIAYAAYIGASLLGLAASCALGAAANLVAIDGTCKLANECASSGYAGLARHATTRMDATFASGSCRYEC